MALVKIPILWTGTPINGSGVSTFYIPEADSIPDAMAALRAFFLAFVGAVPAGVTWNFPTSGVKIDEGTGDPVGSWATGPTTAVVSTSGATSWSKPTGLVINWKTGVFSRGREIRGKTFIVPIVGIGFGSDGRLTPGQRTEAQNAANTLLGAINNTIWARALPAKAPKPDGTGGKPARAGTSATVVSATVPSDAAILRSRRD